MAFGSVLASPSTPAVDRCVDTFVRPDGTFGFEEFRRDRKTWVLGRRSPTTRPGSSILRPMRFPPPEMQSLGCLRYSTEVAGTQ
jgi:hypothetical protein